MDLRNRFLRFEIFSVGGDAAAVGFCNSKVNRLWGYRIYLPSTLDVLVYTAPALLIILDCNPMPVTVFLSPKTNSASWIYL